MSGAMDFDSFKNEIEGLSDAVQALLKTVDSSFYPVKKFFNNLCFASGTLVKDGMHSFCEAPCVGTEGKIRCFRDLVVYIEENAGGTVKDGAIVFGTLSPRRLFSGIINEAYAVCLRGSELYDKINALPAEVIGAFEMYILDSKAKSASLTSASTSRSVSPFADASAVARKDDAAGAGRGSVSPTS